MTLSPAARATAGLGFTQIVGWGTTFLMPAVLGRHIQDVAGPGERSRVRRHHGDVRRRRAAGAAGRPADRPHRRAHPHGVGLGALRRLACRSRLQPGAGELSLVLGGDGHRLDPGAQHAVQHRHRPGRGTGRAARHRHAGHHRRLRLDRVLAAVGRARRRRGLARHAAGLCRDPPLRLPAGSSAGAAAPAAGAPSRRRGQSGGERRAVRGALAASSCSCR